MIHKITSLDAVGKRKLMDLYYEGNLENTDFFYPEITDKKLAVEKVEGDFLKYLDTDFFSSANNVYWILEENSVWVSALRLYKINNELYYRKQVQLPIIECGAQNAPFTRSKEHASDKLYYIEALETHPDYRRQGYASKLLTSVIEELKPHGPFRLCDCVRKKNVASIKTHEKCGFAIVSEEGFDYLSNVADKMEKVHSGDYGMEYSYRLNGV